MSSSKYIFLDKGYTSTVYLIPGTQKICKSFPPENATRHFKTEVEAYTRLSARESPSSILRYYGIDESEPTGIVLELAPNGTLYNYLITNYLRKQRQMEASILYRWAFQAAEGLAFAHSCGVLHADIHIVNFVLDGDLNLKVADFAGASIDGKISWSYYRLNHQLFEKDRIDGKGMKITIKSEIFAFGCALWNMITGLDLWHELDHANDRGEIIRRLKEKEMPDVGGLKILGDVVKKCWDLEYETMNDVKEAIEIEKVAFEKK